MIYSGKETYENFKRYGKLSKTIKRNNCESKSLMMMCYNHQLPGIHMLGCQ